jgi:hypothetical protein
LLRLPNQGPGADQCGILGLRRPDDGKSQIAWRIRLIVLTEPHDSAERCAQLAQLSPAFGRD